MVGAFLAAAGAVAAVQTVHAGGAVRAWGYNFYGQCDVPNELGPCSAVAAGSFHTVAISCAITPSSPTSSELAPYSFANPRTFTATGIQSISTGATLTVTARGNLGTSTKFLTVKIDGVTLATNIFGAGSGAANCASTASTATFTIPPTQFASLTADGELEVRVEPSINATSAGCATATLTVQLNYTRDIADCNGNGLDDECDIAMQPAVRDCNRNATLDACEILAGAPDINQNGRLDACEADCNQNGLPDTYEITANLVPDCNSNGIPDSCDIAAGTSNDVDHNGIPDECKADCNGNHLPDSWEIAQGMVPDCNHNGIPDGCEIAADPTRDCNRNGILDTCEGGSTGIDCNQNGVLDSCEIAANPALDCNASGTLDTCDVASGAAADCNANGRPDSCDITSGAEDDNQNGKLDTCELAYGDLNLDGYVNGADLGGLLSLWGIQDPPYGDLDGNRQINGADLGVLLAHWGPVP